MLSPSNGPAPSPGTSAPMRWPGKGLLALACGAAFAAAAPAGAEMFCSQQLCIVTGPLEEGVGFSVVNDFPVPAHVSLEFTELRNLEADPPEPALRVGPGSAETLAIARPEKRGKAYRYRFQYRFVLGDPAAVHDDSVRYRMPFGGSAPRQLAQGALGSFSHRGNYAFDFKMPVGTPILAARDGRVIHVVDEYERGGRSKSLAGKANKVVVLHGDGTLARYLHLSKGIAVEPGQQVAAGDRLGTSGNTGFTTGPHLHFDVVKATAEGDFDSVRILFESDSPQGFVPTARSYYAPQARSDYAPQARSDYAPQARGDSPPHAGSDQPPQ